jgi:hypothetical protein
MMLLVWPLFILVCKKVKKKNCCWTKEWYKQRTKHTCKKQAMSVSISLIIKFFFNGLLKTATPTAAKRNTYTQKAAAFNDLKSYFMDMCTSWQADRK